MAEGLARKMLASLAEAESTGTHAMRGKPAAKDAVEVMRSRFNIDISTHRCRNATDVPMDDFDYIVAMDESVADDLRRMCSQINARLMESWNIDDPIAGGLEAYERSAREIEKRIEKLAAELRENKG
jgi:protein-tyrosine-phosphatase